MVADGDNNRLDDDDASDDASDDDDSEDCMVDDCVMDGIRNSLLAEDAFGVSYS